MGLGLSLIVIAVGAVLAFAGNVTTTGVDVNMIGSILLVVGIVGAPLSLMFWSSWGGVGGSRRTIVETGPRGRRRIVQDEVL